MLGSFGSTLFGSTEFLRILTGKGRRIALLGDTATHPGYLKTSNQDGRFSTCEIQVCADKCIYHCLKPYPGGGIHGDQVVTAVTKETYVNGRLVVTSGAVCPCGAVIKPPDRRVYIE